MFAKDAYNSLILLKDMLLGLKKSVSVNYALHAMPATIGALARLELAWLV